MRGVRQWGVDIALVLALFAAGWGTFVTNQRLERAALQRELVGDVGVLPDGPTLRVLSLGFERLVADLFWLRTVYYLGDPASESAGYPAAPRLAELVTDIDPYFTSVYALMSGVLSVLRQAPEESYRLLEKGLRYNDHYWKLHFLQGFTLFFDMREYRRAAEHMTAAYERGGPRYLALLATRLYAAGGAPETGMAFIEARLQQEPTPEIREVLEARYRSLWIERDLARIDSAIAAFRHEQGREPASYAELVDAGYLFPEPLDPAGRRYLIEEGRATTTHEYEPMGVHHLEGGL